jgi:hypothetical protein
MDQHFLVFTVSFDLFHYNRLNEIISGRTAEGMHTLNDEDTLLYPWSILSIMFSLPFKVTDVMTELVPAYILEITSPAIAHMLVRS